MRRLIRTFSTLLLCVAVACPLSEARGRNNNNGSSRGNNATPAYNNNASGQRPGKNGQQIGNSGQRPGNNGYAPGSNKNQGNNKNSGNNNNGYRPNSGGHGQSGNNSATKPNQGFQGPGSNGQGGGNGHSPGNGSGGGNGHGPGNGPGGGNGHGPSNGHGGGYGPGNTWAPGPFRPGHAYGHVGYGAPYRPYMPPSHPWSRPMPPAAYTPWGGSMLSTILGVAFGTAINLTINALVNNGYDVVGYANNEVYVANVPQLNMLWPNGTLYYSNGGLVGSQFVYSTPYYDNARFQLAYNRLYNLYGAPYSLNNYAGGGIQASWWGPGGQYITLQLNSQLAMNGTSRYYTTLSFGN